MSENQDPLTDHNYDGIEEYDNPLPSWWLATFFATIIFGFIYWLHYQFGGGPTLKQELAASMKTLQQTAQQSDSQVTESEEKLAGLLKDPKYVNQGAALFAEKCAVCHGPELGGVIGPNLTDNYWIHGKGTPVDIAKVIRDGVPDKGMPSWGPLLSRDQIYSAVALIVSKKGSHPANAKAPQGEKVE